MADNVILDRRRLLKAFAVLPLAVTGLPAWAQQSWAPQSDPEPQSRFRAVGVDTSPMARHGAQGAALAMQQALLPQMQNVFADLIVRNDARAPTLVARIQSVSLASYTGTDDNGFMGPNDYIEGDGLVLDGRRQISSTHILTSLSPSYSGAYYNPDIDRKRLDSIAYQFAYWLRREMDL